MKKTIYLLLLILFSGCTCFNPIYRPGSLESNKISIRKIARIYLDSVCIGDEATIRALSQAERLSYYHKHELNDHVFSSLEIACELEVDAIYKERGTDGDIELCVYYSSKSQDCYWSSFVIKENRAFIEVYLERCYQIDDLPDEATRIINEVEF